MDDNGSTSIDLDLNPDMMTTQTGVPTVVSKPIPLSTSGVIDITPGAAEVPPREPTSQHIDAASLPDHRVLDITPAGPISKELLSDENLKTSYPLGNIVVSSTESFPQGVTPTPPIEETPALEPEKASAAISEIIHEVSPVPPIPPTSISTPQLTGAPTIESPIAVSTTPIMPTMPPLEPAPTLPTMEKTPPTGVEVVLPNPTSTTTDSPSAEELAKLNPLYENPDTVILKK